MSQFFVLALHPLLWVLCVNSFSSFFPERLLCRGLPCNPDRPAPIPPPCETLPVPALGPCASSSSEAAANHKYNTPGEGRFGSPLYFSRLRRNARTGRMDTCRFCNTCLRAANP